MLRRFGAMREDEEGATALEYAIVAAFIAATCAVAVGIFGQGVRDLLVVVVHW